MDNDKDKDNVIKLEDKKKPKGNEQKLDVQNGNLGGKNGFGGRK